MSTAVAELTWALSSYTQFQKISSYLQLTMDGLLEFKGQVGFFKHEFQRQGPGIPMIRIPKSWGVREFKKGQKSVNTSTD